VIFTEPALGAAHGLRRVKRRPPQRGEHADISKEVCMAVLNAVFSSFGCWLRAWGQREPAAPARVESSPLDPDMFRALDSIGLDGAPSMVFDNTMPLYAQAVDRPSASPDRP
jgi:hypothetical protein